MDNAFRLKTSVAGHEFDAEGPVDVVTAAFQAFLQAVGNAPPAPPPQAQTPPPGGGPIDTEIQAPPRVNEPVLVEGSLNKIMKVENRVISLTARPKTAEDAVLLVLYGQKALRENDSVTGAEVLDGIIATGGLQVSRVDRMLEKLGRDGDVIVIGERRAKRYRLTNAGASRARQIAADLIAIVA